MSKDTDLNTFIGVMGYDHHLCTYFSSTFSVKLTNIIILLIHVHEMVILNATFEKALFTLLPFCSWSE